MDITGEGPPLHSLHILSQGPLAGPRPTHRERKAGAGGAGRREKRGLEEIGAGEGRGAGKGCRDTETRMLGR